MKINARIDKHNSAGSSEPARLLAQMKSFDGPAKPWDTPDL
jgi:hypothetical protein